MKRILRNLAAGTMAVCMLAGGFLPLQAETPQDDVTVITASFVNPLYAGIIDEETISHSAPVYQAKAEPQTVLTFNNTTDAADYIREQMVDREENVSFHFETASDDFRGLAVAMMDDAVMHTGNGNEGDYLAF